MKRKLIQELVLVSLLFLLIFVLDWPISSFLYTSYLVFGTSFFSSYKVRNKYKYIVGSVLIALVAVLLLFVDESNRKSLIIYTIGIAVFVLIKRLIDYWKRINNKKLFRQ